MSVQHTTEPSLELERQEKEAVSKEGIIVPLDLPGLSILSQSRQGDGSIEVEVISTQEGANCPHCGHRSIKEHDRRKRRKRDVPLGEHRVVLILYKRRFKCFGCGQTFTEPESACGRYRRTTVRLREQIGEQACSQPISHVADQYGVGPRFVQQCLDAVAGQQVAQRGLSLDEEAPLPTPRFLGIDDFARRKGKRYDTILCDLQERKVLEVSAGRKEEEVVHLLERLSNCDGVEAVSMDMSGTYRAAVQMALPHACIVADHFHVMQHVGKALNKVLGRLANSEEGKHTLDGHRHLFLRAKEDLTVEEQEQRTALAVAFPELGQAWQLKEDLRTWYATASKADAAAGLDAWVAAVKARGPKEMRKALSAFRDWRQEILAFFAFLPARLSNGFVEGKNNRTKAIMREGYGYRNRHNLRTRILLEVA